MKKEVTVELLNKILSYLGNRPYVEVAQLIDEIARLPDLKEPEKVTEKK